MSKQQTDSTALVIIDVQTGFFSGEWAVYKAQEKLDLIKGLIEKAKSAGVPVIFVRHDEAPEYDGPLHPEIAPKDGEPIVSKMTPDSFYETDLQETLEGLGVKKLVLAGFQTDYCIDTTTRRAFSMGYDVTLAEDAHSTVSDDFVEAPNIIGHHNGILKMFATLKPAGEIEF